MIRISSKEVQPHEIRHAETIRKSGAECALFLKRNTDFPVKPCSVNLYGSGARRTIKGGKGSGDVNSRHTVTIEEGLKNAGFTITTAKWLDEYDGVAENAEKEFWAALQKDAERLHTSPFALVMSRPKPAVEYALPLEGDGKINIYVIARNSSEGIDRTASKGDYYLLDSEVRDIAELAKIDKKLIVVLNVGGVLDLTPILSITENILLLGQLGAETGNIFADIITGKSNPSGKLAATWAKNIDDYPSTKNFGMQSEVDYKEGVFVGYRYFDAFKVKPQFPFGFGLGYTQFELKPLNFGVKSNILNIGVCVKNVGDFDGKEVVQVYFNNSDDKDAPFKQLVSFKKTHLIKAGKSEEISIPVDLLLTAAYDENTSAFVLKKGYYRFYVGNSSDNLLCACGLTVEEDYTVEKVNKLTSPVMHELKTSGNPDSSKPLLGDKKFIPEIPVKKLKKAQPGIEVKSMTDENLVKLCVGVFNDMTLENNIGNSGKKVAGSAGETYSDEMIKPLVFADGPAGLRLSKCYKLDGDGNIVASDNALMGLLPGGIGRSVEEDGYFQYCTAIPIGSALAQSWNTELCESMGDIVGKEMQLFGVDVWLAPALNIQRNPLCGRNFEYYSEDPVLSGLIAAAVTEGVQSNDGCSVTVKHFCCNNQETDRFFSSSNMTEKTLREIYLKPFKICIENSHPNALMTSYNLVNGIHTANSRELLSLVLRGEWGYDGLVMTDWMATGGMGTGKKYGSSSASVCIAVSNDLIMPGRSEDIEEILTALDKGGLTRASLEESAGRVLKLSKIKG